MGFGKDWQDEWVQTEMEKSSELNDVQKIARSAKLNWWAEEARKAPPRKKWIAAAGELEERMSNKKLGYNNGGSGGRFTDAEKFAKKIKLLMREQWIKTINV